MKDVQIYGAGLSGLTAAINLAREGHDVTVYEKERQIGGSQKCHPSVHMTPLHFQKMNEFIGINVEPFFSELNSFKAYIYSKIARFSPKNLFVTERGPKKSSLNYRLYQTALENGVNFEFSHPLTPNMIKSLNDESIIATGGYSSLCKHLKLRHVPFIHFDSHKKSQKMDNYCLAYFDTYLVGYGYIAAKDGLVSAQVGFLLSQPYEKYLQKFKKRLKETENLEFSEWSLVMDNYPEKTNLFKKLYGKTFILAGTISGFIDPFFGFGVNSALISGKIAAMTVVSKKRGIQEFKRFTTELNRMFLLSRVYDFLPMRNIIIPRLFKNTTNSIPLIGKNLQNIPGFTHDDCFKIQSIQDER